MATTRAKTKDETDEWDALIASAQVEEKPASGEKRESVDVSPKMVQFVETLYVNGQRGKLEARDDAHYEELRNVLLSAGDKSDKSITVRTKKLEQETDDGKKIFISFTVGSRRGRKPKAQSGDNESAK